MILHITTPEQLQKNVAIYECASLASEGFIHCSTIEQVVEVADYLYRGQKGLILLVIDPKKVKSEIRYEDAGNGKLYPHIHGPLHRDAILRTVRFEPETDGCFVLPLALIQEQ